MIAIVLAAGKGTRLSQFYSCSSKCMIPFEGKPLIDRTLNNISKVDELRKIYIVVRADEEEIPSYLGRKYNEIPIEYCIQSEDNPGIINAIYSVTDIMNLKDEDVLINLGDEYYNKINYCTLIKRHKDKNSVVTPVVIYCENKEEVKKNYTVDFTCSGKILDAVEKPKEVFNNYIGTGIIMISSDILREFATYYKNELNDKQLVDFIKYSQYRNRECYICESETKFCNLNYQKDLEYLYTLSYENIEKTIIELFSKIVNLFPNKVAIRNNCDFLTFKELDEKSRLLAESLKEEDFEIKQYDNGIEYIVKIISALKKGIFYRISEKLILDIASYLESLLSSNCRKDISEVGIMHEPYNGISVSFIYWALLTGKTINFIDENPEKNIEEFISKLNEVDIAVIEADVLKYITQFINYNNETELYTKALVIDRKKVSSEVIHKFFKEVIKTDVISIYGESEDVIPNTMFYINKENQEKLKEIPIGRPVKNTRVYILDSNKKIIGVQNTGEIWIAGDGVEANNASTDRCDVDIINSNMKMFGTGEKGYFGVDGNIYLE